MKGQLTSILCCLAVTVLVAGCTDRDPTTAPRLVGISLAISDGAHGGTPEFFWLPPTVASEPAFTRPFDATALNELTVEICELDAAGQCASIVDQMTSTGLPIPARIRLDESGEYYTVQLMTGRSHLDPDLYYRARVLRNGVELGFIDIDPVRNTPELETVDLTRYVGVVAGQQLTLRFRIQELPVIQPVRINEVESSGGTPGDWVEIYNPNATPVDISGMRFLDNDNAHTAYVIPAGTVIPANGYYLLEEAQFGFGLGSNDSARLFAADGTPVDSYSWTAHAATTYGRCPNGSGDFAVTSASTKGAANSCT